MCLSATLMLGPPYEMLFPICLLKESLFDCQTSFNKYEF